MTDKMENKHDPGWNDPPLFTYDKAAAIQASATKKGISLNKRVAYPMTGKAMTASASPVPSSTPPSLPQMKPPPVCTGLMRPDSGTRTEESEAQKLDKSERLSKVLKNLEAVSPEKDDEEISKRIKVMEKMWMEDKLDEHVQLKLVDLTEALCNGDTDLADRLQMGLMVDYVSQCSSWMSGIRQIINYKRKAKEV
ncbi:UNVERIFIED_CONTAM: hypothetical protein PYX00_003396 [Menopon gallinae]|uniref:SRA1/Sec31 domain-containing protein n=1 Tax=Menopon gallinae TaxID=328185 RepID=A0AAW2HZP0_9NEOP